MKTSIIAFVLFLAVKVSAQNLTQYPYPSEGFQASFTSQPEFSKRDVAGARGTIETRIYLAAPDKTSAIMVEVSDYDPAVDVSDPTALLQSAETSTLSGSPHRVAAHDWITLQGYSGLASEFETATVHFSKRMFLVNRTLYQVLVVSSIGAPYPKTTEFFNSFALIPRTH
jgi:hypothetical protein